jgi:hypothetical protein
MFRGPKRAKHSLALIPPNYAATAASTYFWILTRRGKIRTCNGNSRARTVWSGFFFLSFGEGEKKASWIP